MGYEGGEVMSNHIERLKLLEQLFSYPPRFRLKFKVENIMDVGTQNITVTFNDVHPPTIDTIVLEKAGIFISSFYIIVILTIKLNR